MLKSTGFSNEETRISVTARKGLLQRTEKEMIKKLSLLTAFIVTAFVFSASQADAAVLTARETIRDMAYGDGNARSMFRQRESSNGINERLHGQDALDALITDNQIDSDYGLDNANTVTYRHDLTWLDPEAEEFLEVRIVIIAHGPDGAYEWIRFDGVDAAAFHHKDVSYQAAFRKAIFLDDSVEINILLEDGYLEIEIEKSASTSIVTSLIDVTYVSASTPEPATLALLGIGGAAVSAVALRRRKTQK